MATPNVGILTTAGKALIDKVNSGQAKISFSKVVFSSMDNSQLSDTQIKALTAISPQEVVVSSPETTLDTNSEETRIRATGTNEKLADGVYVKTYGVFAKDDTGNEILYGVTVSPNPNYFPAYDGVTPQAVTYSYKTVIQETSNITMTNSNDVYVSQEDLTEAIAKIPQPDLSGYDKTDDVDKKLQNKQDKLGYMAADDSKVVHDNHDGTIQVNGNSFTPAVLDSAAGKNAQPITTDVDTLCKPGLYYVSGIAPNNPFKTNIMLETRVQYNWHTFEGVQIAYRLINTSGIAVRRVNPNGALTGGSMGPWVIFSDDSKVVHLSGANNFDTVPTVNNNPLLLASSLPSDLARTSQQTNFTAGLQSGGVDVATAADLKSIEASAWRQLDNQYVSADGYAVSPDTVILYKIEEDSKRLYLQGTIKMIDNNSSIPTVSIALTSIVKTILTVSGGYLGFPDGYASSNGYIYHNFLMSAEGITLKTNSVGIAVILYSPYITYDELI